MSARPVPRTGLFAVLVLLFASATLTAQTPPLRALLRDDFTANSLADYQTTGAVAWRAGAVPLARGARLTRKLALGVEAEVRLLVRWPPGDANRELLLSLAGGGREARVGLLTAKGAVLLADLSMYPHVLLLRKANLKAPPTAVPWFLRLHVSRGLTRVKAWPQGTAEPADWRSRRYVNSATWQPERVEVVGGPSGGAALAELTVHSSPPPAPPSREQEALLQRAAALDREVAALYGRGDFAAALEKASAALALHRQALPKDAPAIASNLNDLGALCEALGRLEDARGYLQQALALQRKGLPAHHPRAALTLTNLGQLWRRLGRLDEAHACLQEALTIRRSYLPEDHLDVALALDAVAALMHARGELEQARPLLEKVLAVRRKQLPANHPEVARSVSNLGVLLQGLDQLGEAKALFEEALALRRKAAPLRPADLAASLHNLGLLYHALDLHREARSHLEEALALRRKTLPPLHPDIAIGLDALGEVLRQSGAFEEGLTRLEEALAIRRKALPPRHPALGHSLRNRGALLRNLGRLEEAYVSLTQAVAVEEKALPPLHPDRALSLAGLALVYRDLGRFREARSFLEQALAIQQKALPPTHPALATTLENLGALLLDLGRLEEARGRAEQGLAVRRKSVEPRPAQVSASLSNLGWILLSLGLHDDARRCLEEAQALQTSALPPLHPSRVATLHRLGLLHRSLGRLDQARSHLERSLALSRKVLPPLHPEIADLRSSLGWLLHDLGQDDQALTCLTEALALRRKALPAGHPHLALSLNGLAALLREMGRPGQARSWLERAVAIQTKALAPDHPALASTLGNLSVVCQDLGEHAEARRHLERSLAIKRKHLPAGHPEIGLGLNNLAMLLLDMGRADEALPHQEQALAVFRKALPPVHPDLALAHQNRAYMLAQLGRRVEALDELSGALTIWNAFVTRTVRGSAERDHAPLLGRGRFLLEKYLALAEGGAELSVGRCRELLGHVLTGKAVSTAAMRLRREAAVVGADPQAAVTLARVQTARQELANLLLQGVGRRQPERYRALCDTLRQEVDGLERKLAEEIKGYADLHRAGGAGLDELAARLPPGAVLVEVVRYPSYVPPAGRASATWGPARYAAVLLWRGAEGKTCRLRHVVLGEGQPIDLAVQAWRAAVQTGTVKPEQERVLRERVWGPLVQALPAGTNRLVVAPDGALALVPFEAIREADGKYLVERLSIRYVASGRDLMPMPLPKEKSDLAQVLADPDYDALGDQFAKAGQLGDRGRFRDGEVRAGLRFRPLPGFAREAEVVAGLLKGKAGWTVRSSRGAAASEETLATVKRPRLLYCVTHGFFLKDLERSRGRDGLRDLGMTETGPSAPRLPGFGADARLRSGLALAGANKWQERSAKGLSDGLLTALEVENLDLWGTELVVLSACETGLGQVQTGEGVLGLRRAFQLAGAQTVLASLWKVPDAETEQLMTNFLARWLKGEGKADALRAAQRELIRTLRASPTAARRQAPPLYWAGFICHGGAE